MAVGGEDDTVAGSLPTFSSSVTPVPENELIAGRYRIMRFIGGGGMGRVYEALDTELGEKVALKVVKAGLDDDALERFRREVKLTRRIVHKNVARMFDIGEHNGERFLTMELVDGEPLTRRMTSKPMPWPQVKAIAEQLCAGLAAAHAAGVVHRDLKPDNVLMEHHTDRAVLTDFGIARSGDDPSVTQVGAVVGTPRYMSPEQLAGTEVDARADLFSLGVMLFELATATRPWAGDNAISIAVAQATMAPRSIDTTGSPVPAHFAATVAACLQLDPKDRPASAAEVGAAIAEGRPLIASTEQLTRAARPHDARPRTPTGAPRIVATAPAPEPTSLVVMPIQCAVDDEYLADGLREDLIDTLCATPGIRVKPAGVARGTQSDPREVGQHLEVDHVAVGSLRRTAKGLRITTRLVSTADGFQIWAHKADCSEADVLDVANEIAKGLADALSKHATPEEKVTDQHAVGLFLRAKAELRRFWGVHAQNAAMLLDQAVEYAPTPQILAAAAYAHVQAWAMRGEPELLEPAERALERALAAGHGEAFLASAQYQLNRGNLLGGARDAARALVRAPMTAQVHELVARLLIEIEGPTNARVHYEMARGLDPGRANIIDNDLTRIDALEQKWDDADARNAKLLADPDMSIQQLGMIQRARLASWRGRNEIIQASGKNFISRVSPNAGAIFKLVEVLTDAGTIDVERWNAVMALPLDPRKPLRQYFIRNQVFVEIALALDEPALALDVLERLDQMGFSDRTWIDRCPMHSKIITEPRFNAVAKSVRDRATQALEAFRSVTS